MKKNFKKIFVAGHKGLLGSALIKQLKNNNHNLIFTADKKKLDLINQNKVNNFFKKNNFDEVYMSAAKVGGILFNKNYPAEFIYENLMIAANIINAAWLTNVKKLIFIGSSCIYPKFSKSPIKENSLLSGHLEKTNEAYAIAKISGIKLCEFYNKQYKTDFRAVMLTNLYGPNDNYNLNNSHVIPALINKIHNAKIYRKKIINLWGTGKPKREFLYVTDAAKGIYKVMNLSKKKYNTVVDNNHMFVNIGYGKDITIFELSQIISDIIGYKGKIKFDINKPDGTPQKLLDSSRSKIIKWKPEVGLSEGLKDTYADFLEKSR